MPRKAKKKEEESKATEEVTENVTTKPKRKRAPRKSKSKKSDEPKVPKKRGRKPKGGKIITAITPSENIVVPEPNIILHLKCGMSDLKDTEFFSSKCLKYDPSNISKIDAYQFDTKTDNLNFEVIDNNRRKIITANKNENSKENVSEQTTSNELKGLFQKVNDSTIPISEKNIQTNITSFKF